MGNWTLQDATIILDYEQDFNIKLIIFGCLIFYAIYFYFTTKEEATTFAKIMFNFFGKIYIYTTLVFFPLFTIMLFREYEAIQLWTLLIQMYSVVFVIMALVLMVFGWGKTLEMFGFKGIDLPDLKFNKLRKGERL